MRFCLPALCVLLLLSCATDPSSKSPIIQNLDGGLAEHYAGEYPASSQKLQEAEVLIEEAWTKSISAEAASYFINDNTKEYAGEDYEDIYINVFNSLNYYHQGDLEGALVEIRRVSEKLAVLEQRYAKEGPSAADTTAYFLQSVSKLGIGAFNLQLPDTTKAVLYNDSALARYISAIFYRTEGRIDDARIDIDKLKEIYAASPVYEGLQVPASIDEEIQTPAGMARLNFISWTGRAPVKEQEVQLMNLYFYPVMLDVLGGFALGKIALPVLKERPSKIYNVEVEIQPLTPNNTGETLRFNLNLLENISRVIENTFLYHYNDIFVKTYVRAAIKYASVEAAAQAALRNDAPPSAVYMSVLAAKVLADVTEQADLRCSKNLPGQAWTGGINLQPGTYNISLHYSDGTSSVFKNVEVRPGRLNLIEDANLN
jgi:hypothetical protein